MGYVPSKEELDISPSQSSGYIPSSEEFEEKPQSLSDRAMGLLKGAAQTGSDIGSAMAQHLVNLAEMPAHVVNQLREAIPENRLTNLLPKPVFPVGHFQVPGYNPDSLATQFTEAGLNAAELYPLMGPAGALLKAGASKLPFIGESIAPNATQRGTNFVQNLLKGNRVSQVKDPILDTLRNNYDINKANSTDEYNLLKQMANEQGFTGQTPLEKGLGIKGAKSIEAQGTLNDIDDLDIPEKDPLTDLINKFKQKPSFDNAHELQSRLGSEGYYLKSSSDGMDRRLGAQYLEARRNLLSDIQSSLDKNADSTLSDAYRQATKNYRENVVPYQKNRQINQIVTKRDLDQVEPKNIHNTLAKDDASVAKVVEDLPQDIKDLILAKKISPAIQQSETQGMSVNPDNLLKQLNKVKAGPFEKFLTPEHRNAIADLENRVQFENRYIKPAKKIAPYAAGTVAGTVGLGGLYKLLRDIL